MFASLYTQRVNNVTGLLRQGYMLLSQVEPGISYGCDAVSHHNHNSNMCAQYYAVTAYFTRSEKIHTQFQNPASLALTLFFQDLALYFAFEAWYDFLERER